MLVRARDAVRVRGSYGEGFKAPEFKDLYYAFSNRAAGYQIAGNPNLRAETSRSLNADVEVDLWKDRLRFRVSGFRHQIADLITSGLVGRDPASGLLIYQYANLGKARTMGLESEVTAMPTSWARLAIGYGLLDAEDRNTGEPLVLRARHNVKGHAFVRIDGLGLSAALFGRYLGGRPFADTNRDGRIDDFSAAFAVWDARIGQDVGRNLQLFLGAENLLGERDARYFPSPGRRVYIGAVVKYDR